MVSDNNCNDFENNYKGLTFQQGAFFTPLLQGIRHSCRRVFLGILCFYFYHCNDLINNCNDFENHCNDFENNCNDLLYFLNDLL